VVPYKQVSILVLVDQPSRPRGSSEKNCCRCGFNPCSGGSAVSASPLVVMVESFLRFNPCSGGSAVSAIMITVTHSPVAGFQSLFWWISRLGKENRHRPDTRMEFQFLFWWISRLGHTGFRP